MKVIHYILGLLILFTIQEIRGQVKSDTCTDEFKWDEMTCSHKTLFGQSSGSKSIINPNPHVFDYDVKFYKLDLEASNLTNQFIAIWKPAT
jgi:hypothetical protein